MRKFIHLIIFIILIAILLSACDMLAGGDPALEQTKVALAVQQTSLALDQSGGSQPVQPGTNPEQPAQPTYTPYPTYTVQEPQPEQPQPEQPQPEQPTPTSTVTLEPTPEALFQNVTTDTLEFYCSPGGTPTTLTITVDMSDIDRGGNLFWRLHEKDTGEKLDWEVVDMLRLGSDQRTYTFSADFWAGTANFWYPGWIGESWFEFQIVSNDAADRTEVFSDVTFYPCP